MADGAKLGQQALTLPSGITGSRPASPVTGDLRYNTTLNSAEIYNGSTWGSVGGGAQQDIFYLNNKTVTSNYTIAATNNAMSAGPITIANGITVTVSDGATWTIV